MTTVSRQSRRPKSSRSRWIWLALAIVWITLLWQCLRFDGSILQRLSGDPLPGDLKRALALSEFFAHGFGVAVILLAIFTLAPRLRRAIPRVAACAVLPGCAVNLVKLTVGRYRPTAFDEPMEFAGQTWVGWFPYWLERPGLELGYAIQSFPSGHTAMAFGMAIGLSWLLPRGRTLFFSMAVMAALQRIAFQAHWPSDVLVGMSIAFLVASWVTRRGSRADRMFSRFEQPRGGMNAKAQELKRAA